MPKDKDKKKRKRKKKDAQRAQIRKRQEEVAAEREAAIKREKREAFGLSPTEEMAINHMAITGAFPISDEQRSRMVSRTMDLLSSPHTTDRDINGAVRNLLGMERHNADLLKYAKPVQKDAPQVGAINIALVRQQIATENENVIHQERTRALTEDVILEE